MDEQDLKDKYIDGNMEVSVDENINKMLYTKKKSSGKGHFRIFKSVICLLFLWYCISYIL